MVFINELQELSKLTQDLSKDRLDFGFDSIYFRYAQAIDELAFYKGWYKATAEHKHSLSEAIIQERTRAESQKAHFYNALEQLTHAHKDVDYGKPYTYGTKS